MPGLSNTGPQIFTLWLADDLVVMMVQCRHFYCIIYPRNPAKLN